ncbi:MAG: AbrB/MazE/SpoVT family DNA-binding domain-containing protein [Deltaproteobacteria bacterium]|nr:AbrB/MazE/SpoVT family DNA-binding domain-containing protein [Deltaproteobacteria bacterium]
MSVATVSSKGQITLPAGLRRRLGIAPGDRVVIEAAGDAIVVRPAADLFALAGFLGRALPVE